MTQIIPSFCHMGGVDVPYEVLKEILVKVRNPKVARVCKAFYAVIQENLFWENLARDFIKQGIKFNADQLKDVKGTIQALFALQHLTIKKIHAPLLGTQKKDSLAIEYLNIREFFKLFFDCKELDDNFNLSSKFDSKFDDQQAQSREYCIQYMKNYIENAKLNPKPRHSLR
jgi:hypothetical protein